LTAKRVPGSELMSNICRLSAEKGYKIFIYGSTERVNKSAAEKLNQEYPGIQMAGRCHGYIGDEGMNTLVQEINRSQANVLFVALGSSAMPTHRHYNGK
jgi:Teichoic acid biosynthesis proteins